MTLKFTDGEEFDDTNEHMIIESRKDGFYACGKGMLIPCDTYKSAEETCKHYNGEG